MFGLVGAWALENFFIWLPTIVGTYVAPMPNVDDGFLEVWKFFFLNGLFVIEGVFLSQHFLLSTFYRKAPRFSLRDSTKTEQGIVDFFKVMLPAQFGASCVFAYVTHSTLPRESVVSIVELSQIHGVMPRPLQFLLRLFIMRIAVDVSFYLVHWALHRKPIYKSVHAVHHEHIHPTIWTNYHFTMLDLVLEGFLPFAVGLMVLEMAGFVSPLIETNALLAHVMWYEIGSHSGSTAPVLSFLPPLSLLYRSIFGDIDKDNAYFHHCHHVYRLCNYGITQWLDICLGTKKLGALQTHISAVRKKQ